MRSFKAKRHVEVSEGMLYISDDDDDRDIDLCLRSANSPTMMLKVNQKTTLKQAKNRSHIDCYLRLSEGQVINIIMDYYPDYRDRLPTPMFIFALR